MNGPIGPESGGPATNVPRRNRTVCAPPVTHRLKSAYGWSLRNHTITHPRTGETKVTASPNAVPYYAAIKDGVGFAQRIEKLTDARPGDVISIRLPAQLGVDRKT